MTNTYEIIRLYLRVCESYDSRLHKKVQRRGNNNCPQFTDAEVLTVYLWGLDQQLSQLKAIYRFTKNYLLDCFPLLPTYAAFCYRVGKLAPALEELAGQLMEEANVSQPGDTYLIDTMPVVVGSIRQRTPPRTASELCSVGYCATKRMHYHGVKVSVLGRIQPNRLPLPVSIDISPANCADIDIGKKQIARTETLRDTGATIYADRGYFSGPWRDSLASTGIDLIFPFKRQANSPPLTPQQEDEKHALGSIRQPIECLFAFFDRVSPLQRASLVRSAKGLLAFLWGRLCSALLRSAFYP
jgi:hypothetical protein